LAADAWGPGGKRQNPMHHRPQPPSYCHGFATEVCWGDETPDACIGRFSFLCGEKKGDP